MIQFENYSSQNAGTANSSGYDHDTKGRLVAHRRVRGSGDQIARSSLRQEIEFLEQGHGTPPLFVSYFTTNTPYEALAEKLRASLRRHDLPHHIEPVSSLGSWVANTGLKAKVLEKVWKESDRPICWIDADAEILRKPSFLFGEPCDIAMVRRDGWYDLAGFIYLNKSDATGKLLHEWSQLCDKNPHVWDQVLLTLAWYRTAKTQNLTSVFLNDGIFRFPRTWVRDARDKLFYYPLKKKIRPFIDQKQASRQLKAYINKADQKTKELGSDNISSDFSNAVTNLDFTRDFSVEDIFK